MEPTELEVSESIDMLRILEHGYRVKMVECTQDTHSVDMERDIPIAELLMKDDPVMALY